MQRFETLGRYPFSPLAFFVEFADEFRPIFRMVNRQPAVVNAPASTQTEVTRPKRPSIAVMPLLDLTGDNAQDYFVDGLTEELTTELARYQDFRVIASQSTMHFKGKQADPKTIGKHLGVRFLLSGCVRKDSETVKVTVQLVDTTSGVQIWAENYKRNLTPSSLIDVQETIALNPNSPYIIGVAGWHMHFMGNGNAALPCCRKACN